jgi:hypothetical protein
MIVPVVVASMVICFALTAVVLLTRHAGGDGRPGGDDDGGGGGGGGSSVRRPARPKGPFGDADPPWWPQFERDLGDYMKERASADGERRGANA